MKARIAKKLINKGATIMVCGEKVFTSNVVGKTVRFSGGCESAHILDVSVCVRFEANCREGHKYTFAAVN